MNFLYLTFYMKDKMRFYHALLLEEANWNGQRLFLLTRLCVLNESLNPKFRNNYFISNIILFVILQWIKEISRFTFISMIKKSKRNEIQVSMKSRL